MKNTTNLFYIFPKLTLVFAALLSVMATGFANAASRQMEALDRGVVAVKVNGGVFLSWRFLGTDNESAGFNIYRDGVLVNSVPVTSSTNYTDAGGSANSTYVIKTVVDGVETHSSKTALVWANSYKSLQLKRPANGTGGCSYTPNDCSVGDLDGDGEYELVVKWDPSNAQDNSKSGTTGNVYIDAYKLDGTFLWRIDLGINIRAGAHYTQFQVYDYDGDGKAEVACKTAPGTVDGMGNFVLMGSDDPNKDYRNSSGYVLSGPEYLTMFKGETGEAISSVAYTPARGTVSSWGDKYGNRVDRFLACTAYLDGVHPSLVMCRGYYTRSTLTAYDFKNGKLVQRWAYDSGNSDSGAYGEGYHNLSVADVDNDGFDEIIYGSACIDHDGSLYYRTGFGHGDAMHVSDLDPSTADLEGWFVHEETGSAYGFELRNLRTGKVIFGEKTNSDVGRGLAADIDAKYPGFECWSTANGNVYDCKGNVISTKRPSVNFRIYWDGDLQDELLDGNKLDKWNGNGTTRLFSVYDVEAASSCNSTKATPCLSADIFGDWREEMIFWNGNDPSKITIFTTTIPTEYRLFTLMHDPVYRMGVAWQNTAYNQPPHLGFYIGDGLDNVKQPDIYVVENGSVVVGEPTLTKQGAGSSSQAVEPSVAIVDFNYEWANASSVKVSWSPAAPEGVEVVIDNAAKKVFFSGSPAVSGTYLFTVETVSDAEMEAVKSGQIVVGDGKLPPASIGRWGSGGARNQTVIVGNPIVTTVYNYSYAEGVEVLGALPEGVVAVLDAAGGQLRIGGAPHEIGVFSYSLKTYGGSEDATDVGGTITVIEDTTLAKLDVIGDLCQSVDEGEALETILFSWGAGTKNIKVDGEIDGLTISVDGNTATVSGEPKASGVITVSSVGNGEVISHVIEVEVIPASLKKVAYVTDASAANYVNDTKILPALKADKRLYVSEIDAQQASADLSRYDLVVISEVAASNAPVMAGLEGIGKPVLNLKVHVYKVAEGTWAWAETGYGDNKEVASVSVEEGMLTHPMFKDVSFVNGNEIVMFSEISTKALTYMNPASFLELEGNIATIAKVKGNEQVNILEIPAGTSVAGNLLTETFLQIGLNSSSFAYLTDDGVSVVLNACEYLLKLEDEEATNMSVSESDAVGLTVAPNPVTDKSLVTLESKSDGLARCRLFSSGGACVKILPEQVLMQGRAEWTIERGTLPPGIYTLQTEVSGATQETEVILK